GGADACVGLDATGSETFTARPVKLSRWGTTFAPFLGRFDGKPGEPLRVTNLGHLSKSTAELGEEEERLLGAMTSLELTASTPAGRIKLAEVKLRLGVTRTDHRKAKALERAADRLADAERLERHPTLRRTYRTPRPAPDHDPQLPLVDPEEE